MTPCEEKGYKAGDRFVTEGSSQFGDGSIVELYQDDGDQAPLFKLIKGMCRYRHARGKYGAYTELASVTPIRQPLHATLTPGDYVSTEGMDEATYHAVARAFMASGASEGEYPFDHFNIWNYIGWHPRRGCLEHWDSDEKFGGNRRQLSVIEILATSLSTTTDPITTLRTAKATLDDARDAYSKALDAVRDELGEGFVLVEDDSVLSRDEPDMTDPANWRAGDVVECLFKNYIGYNYGDKYRVGKRRYDGKRIGVIDDEGFEQSRLCRSFRFHHRPNT